MYEEVPSDVPVLVSPELLFNFCVAEIHDLEFSLVRQHHVLRFDVAMDAIFAVPSAFYSSAICDAHSIA